MNIDKFLDQKYNATTYNCGHYVAEVYKELTGVDIDYICKSYYNDTVPEFLNLVRGREKLELPKSPCIAVMKMPNAINHAGIYIEGRILHLTDAGPKFDLMEIVKLHYRLSFYK